MKKTALLFGLAAAILGGCENRSAHEAGAAANSPPINLDAALLQAKTGNKLVLLDFTGSDWCAPCIRLKKEVFSKPEFGDYSKSNLVFLEVDFPQTFKLPEQNQATNAWLAEKFDVSGYPTLIALDASGQVLWKTEGAPENGLQGLIGELEKARQKK